MSILVGRVACSLVPALGAHAFAARRAARHAPVGFWEAVGAHLDALHSR